MHEDGSGNVAPRPKPSCNRLHKRHHIHYLPGSRSAFVSECSVVAFTLGFNPSALKADAAARFYLSCLSAHSENGSVRNAAISACIFSISSATAEAMASIWDLLKEN